ncbi:MAG: PD-(D/E)XK nuclease family protein, partial [Pseudomonadota bacterium]
CDAAVGLEVSVAPRLGDYPAVHTALQLVEWAAKPIRFAALSRLLRQPAISDVSATAAIDVALRERPDRFWTPVELADWLRDTPFTLRWLTALQSLADTRNERGPASVWATRFATLLDDIGWLRDGAPDSAAFQLMNAMHASLNVLASLDPVVPAVTLAGAHSQLQRILSDTVYQPQAAYDNLLLCGPLELAGMTFDAIWLAGCDASHWPPLASPSALLPPALQRAHDMPDASAAQSRRFWSQQFRQLSAAGDSCMTSFARHDADSELLPSPVIAARKVIDAPPPERGLTPWIATAKLQKRLDDAGTFASSRTLKGGFRALERQQSDPFGALIVGRWQPQLLREPEVGVSAMLRGSLVHDSLEVLFTHCSDQQQLQRALGDSDNNIVDTAIGRAFKAHFVHQDALTKVMLRAEEVRTRELVLDFIKHELQRAPFSIEALEHKVALTIGPVTMNLRIDRIDRVADQRLIIDYKTGAPGKKINADRLVDDYPQLACYLLAVEDPVAAIALAWINPHDACWDSLRAAVDPQLPQARVTKTASDTLADVRALSESGLRPLADAFASGVLAYSAQLYRNRDLWLEFAPITRIAMEVADE